jgi:hypothetical protein
MLEEQCRRLAACRDAECFKGLKTDTDARISEGPGKRKPHAGTYAGAVQLTGCPAAMAAYTSV